MNETEYKRYMEQERIKQFQREIIQWYKKHNAIKIYICSKTR